jgi:hypothetical protein
VNVLTKLMNVSDFFRERRDFFPAARIHPDTATILPRIRQHERRIEQGKRPWYGKRTVSVLVFTSSPHMQVATVALIQELQRRVACSEKKETRCVA